MNSQPESNRAPVVIAGGGIGGLALSLALAARGMASVVLERADAFTEVGAGIQLGPNAIHALNGLGVGDAVVHEGDLPAALELRDLAADRLLKRTPLGDEARRRYGAPYVMAYRPDLLNRLLERASGNALIDLRCGCEVTGYDQTPEGVNVHLAIGGALAGHAVIGCDGLHSAVRNQIVGDAAPVASKRVGYRARIPRDAVPEPYWCSNAVIWLGTGLHVVQYPLRGGQWLNVVVCRTLEGGDDQDDTPDTLARLAEASPRLRWLADAGSWHRKRLYEREPAARWVDGRATLLGDAAHPILPHVAQGAAMALEDALVLAAELAARPDIPEAAFLRYAEARQPRTSRVQALARHQGDLFHAGAASFDGHAPRALGEFDWIYGYQAPLSGRLAE